MILAAAAALLAVFACKKNPAPSNTTDSVTVTPATATFTGEGGSVKLAIETEASPITAESSDSWLTATVDGKELNLTASPNTEKAARNATVTVKAGSASATVSVSQDKASAYPGYIETKIGEVFYAGVLLQKMTGKTKFNGGQANIMLASVDGRYTVNLDIFTECFESAEEVTLTTGTYKKGKDDISKMQIIGEAKTWVPGKIVVLDDDGEEEELQYGSFMVTAIGEVETVTQIIDGTVTISEKDGVYTIKTDLKDDAGADVKFYYEGPVKMNTEGAVYPVEEGADPTDIVAVVCTYMGESVYNATNIGITLACEYSYPMSLFSIYIDHTEPGDLEKSDLSGTYTSTAAPGRAGAADIGLMQDFGEFSFPMGSYITYGLLNYFIPDDFVSLTLVKKESGKYIITGTMRNSEGEEFNFADDKTEWEIEFPVEEEDDD